MNMPKGLRRTAARFCPLLAAAASLLALVSSANAATITTTVVSDAYALDLNNDGITETACCPTDGFIRVFGTVEFEARSLGIFASRYSPDSDDQFCQRDVSRGGDRS